MTRAGVVFVVVISSTASADKKEPPVQFEAGINTRHFGGRGAGDGTALRTEAMQAMAEAQSAVTVDLRFTRWTPFRTFIGVEGEIGKLTSDAGSNLAGTYGLLGGRFHVGPAILAVELASGWRTVRYNLSDSEHGKFVFEPRARAQLWAGSRVTFGAAAGATIGAQAVFMAGVYIGVHSLIDGHKQP